MSPNSSKFMNIWEIEDHFKCPVLGAMLSVEKHKNILKKCGYEVKNMKPHEYHRQIMEKLHGPNDVSVKVNNYIRSRARKYMEQIDGLSETGVRALWKEQLENGNVGPMMYAIVSHEDTGLQMLTDVHGEVHMLAHANMTGIFDVRRKLAKTDAALKREQEKQKSKNREIRALAGLRKTDAGKIMEIEAENRSLRQQVKALESAVAPSADTDAAKIKILEREIGALTRDLDREKQERQSLERRMKAIKIDLFSAQSETELIQKEFSDIVSQFKSPVPVACDMDGSCTETDCPEYRLCAKRIFMIGGITKMKSFYKDIVEKAGGEFDYHDGYLTNTNANLEAKVKRCDLVLCPVNCNSHNACIQVKKLCSRYNKQLKILSGSSLSAVTRALFTEEHPVVLN